MPGEVPGGTNMTSSVMAGSVGTNEVVIRRLLGILKRAGLVESKPGSGGGWTLNRRPEMINLAEIYRIVEQNGALAMHDNPSIKCETGRNIQDTLTIIYTDAQKAMEQSLSDWTLADVHRQLAEFESRRA